MVEYLCIPCSFKTHIRSHYERHCLTKKHNGNIQKCQPNDSKNVNQMSTNVNQCQPLPKKYFCSFCSSSFNTRQAKSKHQKNCKDKLILSTNCQPIVNQIEPKLNPIEPKLNPIEPKLNPPISEPKLTNSKKFICVYCNKEYSTNSHMRRHEKKCNEKTKLELQKVENNNQIDLLKKEIMELKNSPKLLNNIQNNSNNNNTINYLNINFNNVQPIEDFLDNLKNNYQLSVTDRKCLLNTYNECGIDAFAETFSIIMKKYQSQQVEQGILPTMPIVCTDGNLRSFKEFHQGGWKSTQSNSSIDKMIDISNDQIYKTENTKIFITSKERKKIHNRIKMDNNIINIEEIKKKYELCIQNKGFSTNDGINEVDEDNEEDEEVEDNDIDLNNFKDLDFSHIDDDFIEKYSKI